MTLPLEVHMAAPKKLKEGVVDYLCIAVVENGYSIEVPGETDDDPDQYFVFNDWKSMTDWLFNNVSKPAHSITN